MRLTAEKSRLAKAETEIARLLRERAVSVAEQALKEAEAHQRALAAARPKYPASPAAYVRAASVLRQLEQEADRAEARRESDQRAAVVLRPAALPETVPTVRQLGAAPERPVLSAPGASAESVVAVRQRARPASRVPNFSFFGRSGAAGAAAVRAAAPAPAVGSVTELGAQGDLADVLGDEALAESARYAARQQPAEQPVAAPEPDEQHARPEVVDLTPHDDTEIIQVAQLRAELG